MMQSNEHDISVVNSLITTTIDSARGFERSAEDADLPQFIDMFRSFSGERRQVVGMLQEHVRKLGGEPNDDGSLKADLHRRWVDLRDAISKGGDREIIEEVERGEDYLKEKFEAALESDQLTGESRAAVERAYQSVRSGHDQVSQLKHGLEA